MDQNVVRLLVKLEAHRLIFTHLLPSEESALSVGADLERLPVRLWTGHDCLNHIGDIAPADVHRHVNLMINRFHVEISLGEVDPDLINYVVEGRGLRKNDGDAALDEKYEQLGLRVFDTAMYAVNRLLEYARVEKGQYWLGPVNYELENQYSFFNASNAEVSFGTRNPVRWSPPRRGIHASAYFCGDNGRYLTEAVWHEAGEYLRSPRRPDLVNELLARAEQLLDDGYLRASVIESVVAFEIAIDRFVKAPAVHMLAARAQTNRIDLAGLPKLRDKLGLRGTVSYLLPLVLDDESLPEALLDSVRQAITLRGNLVHNGQRMVAEAEAGRSVRSVRQACTTLAGLTKA